MTHNDHKRNMQVLCRVLYATQCNRIQNISRGPDHKYVTKPLVEYVLRRNT